MIDFIWALGSFLLVVGLLVIGHEFGHFWVARKLGVKVLRFSIGFGKPIWLKRGRDGTEFVLAPVPLGGYVRMLDEAEAPVNAAELHRAFNRQPLWKRVTIVCAGPLANFLLAILAYWIMYMSGIEGAKPLVGEIRPHTVIERAGVKTGDLILGVDGKPVVTWTDASLSLLDVVLDKKTFTLQIQGQDGGVRVVNLDLGEGGYRVDDNDVTGFLGFSLLRPVLPPVVGVVADGERAAQAGLRSGDRLAFADGEPVTDWARWADYVANRPERPIELVVERQGAQVTMTLTPAAIAREEKTIGRIGASPEIPPGWGEPYLTTHRYSPGTALVAAARTTGEVTKLTLVLMGKMITGEASLKNVSGPVTIAQFAGQSARVSMSQFLFMLALISIGLGILNLLPIPVLDGGHLLYYFAEFLKGSPVSKRTMEVGQQGGLIILFGLMTLALYNDFVRWF